MPFAPGAVNAPQVEAQARSWLAHGAKLGPDGELEDLLKNIVPKERGVSAPELKDEDTFAWLDDVKAPFHGVDPFVTEQKVALVKSLLVEACARRSFLRAEKGILAFQRATLHEENLVGGVVGIAHMTALKRTIAGCPTLSKERKAKLLARATELKSAYACAETTVFGLEVLATEHDNPTVTRIAATKEGPAAVVRIPMKYPRETLRTGVRLGQDGVVGLLTRKMLAGTMLKAVSPHATRFCSEVAPRTR